MQTISLPRLVVTLALALALAACGGGYKRSDRPAEVEARTAPESLDTNSGNAQVAAYTPPAQPRMARPVPKRAVAVLMRRADDQKRAGDLDAAVVSLERALRISPQDAMLWHRLAGVRMSQGRYSLVTQLAAKSNTLAVAGDRDLQSENWLLIARARRAQGNAAGARAAERRASTLH